VKQIFDFQFLICDWKKAACALLLLLSGCGAIVSEEPSIQTHHIALPTSAPATRESADPWAQISAELGRAGVLKNDLDTFTFPRDDLNVTIEGMDVPTGAGLETVFWFYRCSCGKMSVVGQFVVADYEANDVIDSLRAGQMKVASVAPLLLYEKPRLLLIRFQAEGEPTPMAKTLREALRWTGKERMAPRRINAEG
jgi:uncharacterized protein YceK